MLRSRQRERNIYRPEKEVLGSAKWNSEPLKKSKNPTENRDRHSEICIHQSPPPLVVSPLVITYKSRFSK